MITSKKLNKKLTLKKETIANLKKNEMKGIKGGSFDRTFCNCSMPDYCHIV
jgi:natural product precursor